jgi:colanic acid biosynthesis protein WcaH
LILSDIDYKKIMESMPVVCIDCLVQNAAGEFLLIKRKNEPLKGEFWVPGGRLLRNERLEDAVHRKMFEELGVDVEIVKNLGFYEEFFDKTAQNAEGGFHAVSFLYLVRPLTNNITLDDQSDEWGWFKNFPQSLRTYKTLHISENL